MQLILYKPFQNIYIGIICFKFEVMFLNKKLICFDLDDTLINSDKSHIEAYNYALKKLKLKTQRSKFLIPLFGMPHSRLIEIIAPNLSKEKMDEVTEIHDEILVKKTYKYSKVFPGIIKTLKFLMKHYDIALVSNSSHKNILALLKGSKLDKKFFKIIIGNDDVKRSKPWPDEIFKAEHLEKNKAYFMVGDSIYDIIAGRKAGVKTIGVLTGHYAETLLRKQGASYVIKSVKDLPSLLEKVNNK